MSDQGPYDTGRRDSKGNAVWEMTRHAFEALPDFHREGGTLRSRCPAHRGENPSALRVSEDKGVGTCGRCGITVILIDHPAQRARQEDWERQRAPIVTIAGRPRRLPPLPRPKTTEAPAWKPASAPERPTDLALMELRGAMTAYRSHFIGSPGEAYVAKRHIPFEVADQLGWGWGGDGPLLGLPRLDRDTGEPTRDDYFRRRVTMPLSGPDGVIVGAFGRSVYSDAKLKYLVTGARRGIKAMVNGGAVSQAIAADEPLIIVEGPVDAAAILAGGLPLVVAIGSTTYGHPRHFRGLRHAFVLGDNDGEAGSSGARKTRDALELEGVHVTMLNPGLTGDHKDVADYWAACGELPAGLIAASRTTAPPSRWAGFGQGRSGPSPRTEIPDAVGPDPRDGDQHDRVTPDAVTLPAGRLSQLVARDGIDRLSLADIALGEAHRTAAEIVEDDTYSADDFAGDIADQWDELPTMDRIAAWAAWQIASRAEHRARQTA